MHTTTKSDVLCTCSRPLDPFFRPTSLFSFPHAMYTDSKLRALYIDELANASLKYIFQRHLKRLTYHLERSRARGLPYLPLFQIFWVAFFNIYIYIVIFLIMSLRSAPLRFAKSCLRAADKANLMVRQESFATWAVRSYIYIYLFLFYFLYYCKLLPIFFGDRTLYSIDI